MKTKLRRGSITLWDLLGAFLGVLIVLGTMTFLRIRDFERIKREVRSSLPERSEKRTERGNYGHACGLEQPAPPPTVADGLQVLKTGGRDTVGENDSLGEIARDHTALDEALGEIYVVVGKRLYRLAPVADEEFKQLAAPAVGIFSCIGFHGDNHITSTSKEATAKMKIKELQEKIAEALNGVEELIQGGCKAFAEDSREVYKESDQHVQKGKIAVVVVTPDMNRNGANVNLRAGEQAEQGGGSESASTAIPAETQLLVQCSEKPALARSQQGVMTALDAAEIVMHALDGSQFCWLSTRQTIDRQAGVLTATVTFSTTIHLSLPSL